MHQDGHHVTRFKIIMLAILGFAFGEKSESQTHTIEVYLLKEIQTASDTDFYFSPTLTQIADTPFIRDSEIIGYEIVPDTIQGERHLLLLNKSGQRRVGELSDISLQHGLPFAVVVDNVPIYGGYFWNYFSSFSCDWITVPAFASDKLEIKRGLPYYYFTKDHPDPRNDERIMASLLGTGRLTRKY